MRAPGRTSLRDAPANGNARGTFNINPLPSPNSSVLLHPQPLHGNCSQWAPQLQRRAGRERGFYWKRSKSPSPIPNHTLGKSRGSFRLFLQKDKESAVSALLSTRSLPCSQRQPFYLGHFLKRSIPGGLNISRSRELLPFASFSRAARRFSARKQQPECPGLMTNICLKVIQTKNSLNLLENPPARARLL